MKKIACEICGADLEKQEGMFVCQSCGCKYSIEEVKRLMMEEGDGGVVSAEVGMNDELKNLYELARRAKDDGNSENAQKYYEMILLKNSSCWEANFYSTYYQSMNCKIVEIGIAAKRITGCEESVFNLIKNNIANPDEQRAAVTEVAIKLRELAVMLYSANENHYVGIPLSVKNNFTQEYITRGMAVKDILYNSGDLIIGKFGDACGDIAADCWMLGQKQHYNLCSRLADIQGNVAIVNKYIDKARRAQSRAKAIKKKIEEEKAAERKTAQEAKEARIKAYWEVHSEEKEKIDAEIKELSDKKKKLVDEILTLTKEINTVKSTGNVPAEEEIDKFKNQINELLNQRATLGVFAGKKKKLVDEEIADLYKKIDDLKNKVEEEKKARSAEIFEKTEPIKAKERELERQVSDINKRISDIKATLTKDPE